MQRSQISFFIFSYKSSGVDLQILHGCEPVENTFGKLRDGVAAQVAFLIRFWSGEGHTRSKRD